MTDETKSEEVVASLVEKDGVDTAYPPFYLQKYPDGTGLLFIAKGMAVFCYKILLELRFLMDYRGHTGNITALTFDQETQYLFTAGKDKTVRVWNVKTGLEVRDSSKIEAISNIEDLVYNPNTKILYARCKSDDIIYRLSISGSNGFTTCHIEGM